MQGQKKNELTIKQSYLKLSRKRQIDKIGLFQSEVEKKQERVRAGTHFFNYKTQSQAKEPHQRTRQNSSLIKKYVQARSREKQMVVLRGVTPFQSRKIMEKNKTSKTITKILEKNKTEEQLQGTQKNWLIVREANGREKEDRQKSSENIRQTDTTLKDDLNGSNSMIRISQSNMFDESKKLLNSWVFHNSHAELKKQVNKDNLVLKNTKMTLKELWKAKFQLGIQEEVNKNDNTSYQSRNMNRHKEKDASGGYKKPRRQIRQIFPKQTTIHSKSKSKPKVTGYQCPSEFSSSALKIQPCPLETNPAETEHLEAKNKPICWSSSDTKIELRQSFKKQTQIKKQAPKARSNFSYKKVKTQQNPTKQVSGWQYVNDFSEREHFF